MVRKLADNRDAIYPLINQDRGAVSGATAPAVKLSPGRPLSETRPIPRRGLSRTESAMYVGISPNKFNQLVEDGRMPKPIHLDGRRLWDVRKLDQCFDALDIDPSSDQSWADFGEGC